MTTHVIEIPFHIGDFLSGTMHMDGTEIGAYWMLCVAHYQAGLDGLEDNDRQLARIAKVSSKVWSRIRPVIAKKFEIEGGYWRQKKVVEVLLKVSDVSAQNSAKSLKRWRRADPPALPEESQPKTNNQVKKDTAKKTPDLFAKAEEIVGDDNPYWFTGAVIRLRKKDYNELLVVYGGSDEQFMAWLTGRDQWFRDKATPEAKKNWFHSTLAAVRKVSSP